MGYNSCFKRSYILAAVILLIFSIRTSQANSRILPENLDPETNDWISRVTAGGGAVSDTVVVAVDDYVKEIKGLKYQPLNIRNLIFRENWYCGNFLAAFIPLFRSTNGGSPVLGGNSDVNRNYAESDYIETGSLSGLKGNGANRYLETGLVPHLTNEMPLTDIRFMMFSMSQGTDPGRSGCRFDGIALTMYPRYTNGQSYVSLFGTSETGLSIPSGAGYISAQRRTNTLNDFYYRDNLINTYQNNSANYKPNAGITIGAFNNSGNVTGHMSMRLGGYSIGKSFTPAQAKAHYDAVMRLMTALGRITEAAEAGEIRSNLLTFTGRNLFANYVSRPGGFVQFELQDQNRIPLPGFSFNECPQYSGDEFEQLISWQGENDLSDLVNTPVYLIMRISNSDVFTIQFRNSSVQVDSSVIGFKIGTYKQFFADSLLFPNSMNVLRRMHQPVKNPEPIISPTAPWEGDYIITTYSNVGYSKSVDHDAMVYKMWLRCVNQYGRVPVYYESFDGLNWLRPNLQLFKYNNSADNNIMSDSPYPGGFYTVVDDSAHNQYDSTRRFKSVYNTHPTYADSRLNISFSSDGLVWIPYEGNPVRYIGEDLHSSGWNPVLGKYLGYFRDSLAIRKVGRYLSDNWVNWTYTGTILKPEPFDIKSTHFYNMAVMFKDSVYWGFSGVMRLNANNEESPANPSRTDNTVFIALLFSRDGINFTRCANLVPFINYGELGEWDDQMVYTIGVPVRIGNEYYIYYNGFNFKHMSNAPAPHGGGPKKAHVGLARIGVDRFISLTAY